MKMDIVIKYIIERRGLSICHTTHTHLPNIIYPSEVICLEQNIMLVLVAKYIIMSDFEL